MFIVILTSFLVSAAQEVVIFTNSDVVSDEILIKMTTIPHFYGECRPAVTKPKVMYADNSTH